MPTPDRLILLTTFTATLTSALIAGVFFAFSTFVMRPLARLPAHHAIPAMQSINIAVLNPLFLTPFLGTALLSLLAATLALTHRHHPASPYLLTGSALYLLGTFLVTLAFNVPLNNTLAP